MKQKIKIHEILLGIIISLALIMIFLISSFEIGAYGSWDYFQKEYEKHEVADDLNMEMTDIMEVTKYMMSYLRGNEEVLSIETMVDGEMQDFFNEQDRLHMKDVQDLFIGGLWLRRISVLILVAAMIALWKMKSDWKMWLPSVYQKTLMVLGIIVAFLAFYISQNFNRAFVIFHEIFFDNDLWIFDPRTDYMIRMLPEGFFFDIVIRIGSIFIGFLVGSLFISIIMRMKVNKK